MHNKIASIQQRLKVLIILFATQLGGCAVMYSSADVTGRVVDTETGEPIEGAVVVGIWQLESQGFEHSYGDAIHVVESVSDAMGHYRLKGFDTKLVGPFRGELRDSDPYISVFADGYKPDNAGSETLTPLKHSTGHHRVSPYNEQDIRMEKAELDDRFIAGVWNSSIRRLVNAGDCATTKLTSLSALLKIVEPRCDRILMEGYGMHCDYFHDAKERCEGDGAP